ncbi:MAG: ParA family protein [Aestuariivita sp.]|nr:ParA family protein [Aestuariivita sp.]
MCEISSGQSLRIIAITNQKGGVGKTTTAINLAAALAELNKKILLVDIDPQGNASTGLGIDENQRMQTTYDLLFNKRALDSVISQSSVENLFVIPSNMTMSFADVELMEQKKRSFLLRQVLRQEKMKTLGFNFIFIDCPPSLNLMTVNAMVAAHAILVPLQSEFFALEGLSQLILTVREVRKTGNQNLRIDGILLTMFDRRNNLSHQVAEDVRKTLGELVFKTVIPRNVRLSEAPSHAMPVLTYDTHSSGAKAYRDLANEFLEIHAHQ